MDGAMPGSTAVGFYVKPQPQRIVFSVLDLNENETLTVYLILFEHKKLNT